MIKNKELQERIKQQLAIEFNCDISDFNRKENLVTISKALEGRRQYINGAFFLHMVTLGQNTIVTAVEEMQPFLKEFVRDKCGHELFEFHALDQINQECKKYGQAIYQTHHMFLPSFEPIEMNHEIKVRWYEQEKIGQFYGDKRFPNAFCAKFYPERPDTLAVSAYDSDGTILGMAGCSADTSDLWQIGIDVDPAYRGHQIGTTLVLLLKNEIIRRGKIPFYGTSLSNLHSWNIALNCGFYPAWVEAAAFKIK